MNFLSLVITTEALRANIDWKLAFLKGVVQIRKKFPRSMERSPRTIFARINRPVNALQDTTLSLTVFIQRNFVADFLQVKCNNFRRKTAVLRFCASLKVRSNVRCLYYRFIEKLVVDFLLV